MGIQKRSFLVTIPSYYIKKKFDNFFHKMVLGKRFVLKHHFDGMPKPEDFDLVQENLPPLKEGEILIESLYLTVDPYMRVYTKRSNPPYTMIGQNVAKIIESKDPEYPKDSIVLTKSGWVKTGIVQTSGSLGGFGIKANQLVDKVPDLPPGLSQSVLLGVCGMPGCTAYFGFLEICQPKAGETVVVNGAAGAVGSLVGQIAKIKGCHVIGFAGSDEKCKTLLNKYGFDKAYNYKKTTVQDALKDGAPNGIDCFFDNVGGEDAAVVINSMNEFGRVSCCGAISVYNDIDHEWPRVPMTTHSFVFSQLKMEGFLVTRWLPRWEEAIGCMAQWIMEGKIKTPQTVVEGFEKMPDALIGLFTGANKGKMVVKA